MNKRSKLWAKIRMLIALSLVILVACAIFLVYGRGSLAERGRNKLERTKRSAELGWLTLTGRRIKVNGYRLHFECSGEGKVTVVLDAGLTMTTQTWSRVDKQLSKFTRVCVYDRAGLGDSDPGPQPRTSQLIVSELHTVLANAGVLGPYVLAGHSFGGFNVRLFANKYPNEVVGLVLIDASHEDQSELFAAQMSAPDREKYLRHQGGENRERVDILASAKQVHAAPIPAVPLVVLSAGQFGPGASAEDVRVHDELQAALVRLSPKGRRIIAERSGHFIQETQPELVVEAIRSVVDVYRGS